jgi:thiol:disulfide interchange protein
MTQLTQNLVRPFAFLNSFLQTSVVFFCIFISAVSAQESLSAANNAALGVKDEFLPVTEAFKLKPQIVNNQLQLEFVIAPGYYLYQKRFKLNPSNGLTLTPEYSESTSKYDPYEEKEVAVYHDKATINLALPANTTPFDLQVTFQGCADAGLCYPPHKTNLSVDPSAQTVSEIVIAVDSKADMMGESAPADVAPVVAPPRFWLIQAMVLAMLGGMILNLMPCVFPVLSLKVMSLAQAERSHIVQHGWVYTGGIVLCFLVFATILLIARAGGEAIGWGFQLQSPVLIGALTYLFFIMGLSMSGMIHIGTSWMGAGQSLTEKSGLTGSFFTGVLAAVVASPCTAPFMGAALGFALTQPGFVSLLVFASLGFGMALPMLILCYVPALADRLPRPGAWMENLKEILAFPLYLTSVWLLWVLGRQAGVNALVAVCAGGVLFAFSIWLLNHSTQGAMQQIRRGLILACWIFAVIIPYNLINGKKDDASWQPYSAELLQELRDSGKPVFIDLTADWCITCLANEKVALNTDDVKAVLKEKGIVTVKGDWTNRDPRISDLLNEYQRSGVPLYLWFPANHQGKGIILPQILTKSMLIDTFNGVQ